MRNSVPELGGGGGKGGGGGGVAVGIGVGGVGTSSSYSNGIGDGLKWSSLIHSGYLLKKGGNAKAEDTKMSRLFAGKRRNWKQRWFELELNAFTYFDTKGEQDSLGCINLTEGFTVEKDEEKPLGFILHAGDRSMALQAISEEDFGAWMLALSQVQVTVGTAAGVRRTGVAGGSVLSLTPGVGGGAGGNSSLVGAAALSSGLAEPLSTTKAVGAVLASYVPRVVLSHCMDRAKGQAWAPLAQDFEGAVVFCDISGFTALTERLAREGPYGAEKLVNFLNDYFGKLVRLVTDSGGDVMFFAGDALLAVWKGGGNLRHSTWAATQCAWDMMQKMNNAADPSQPRLHMGIGAGNLSVLHVGGNQDQWIFLTSGEPLNQISPCVSAASPHHTVLSPAAWNQVKDRVTGEQMPEGGLVRLTGLKERIAPGGYVSKGSGVNSSGEIPWERLDMLVTGALRMFIPRVIQRNSSSSGHNFVAEMRRVTVMFVNINGLDTTKSSCLNRVHQVVGTLQTCIYKYGGVINKMILDDKGFVIVAGFGLPPLAHQNNEERSVLAAILLRKELSKISVVCAIGLTTGRAFCGIVGSEIRREYTMIGDVVNTSARLMTSSEDNITCDGPTMRAASATNHRLLFTQLESKKFKGKAEAMEIFRPICRRVLAKELRSLADMNDFNSPLVGRLNEMLIYARQLDDLLKGEGLQSTRPLSWRYSHASLSSSPFSPSGGSVGGGGGNNSPLSNYHHHSSTSNSFVGSSSLSNSVVAGAPPPAGSFSPSSYSDGASMLSSSHFSGSFSNSSNISLNAGGGSSTGCSNNNNRHSMQLSGSPLNANHMPPGTRNFLILIEGEAGLGKSRLLEEMKKHALTSSVRVCSGVADSMEKSTPFYPWRAVIMSLLDMKSDDDHREGKERIHRSERERLLALRAKDILADVVQPPELLPLLNSVLCTSLPETEASGAIRDKARIDKTAEILVDIIRKFSSKTPMVLLLDDLHSFDSSSRSLAVRVAQCVPNLLLVYSMRVQAHTMTWQQQLYDIHGVHRLHLSSLSDGVVQKLVERRLGVTQVSKTIAHVLTEKSGGNPFFAEALVDSLRDSGAVVTGSDGSLSLLPSTDLHANNSIALPDSLEEMLTAKFDQLTTTQLLTLKVASALGPDFDADILHDIFPGALAGTVTGSQIDADIDTLVGLDIFHPSVPAATNPRRQHDILIWPPDGCNYPVDICTTRSQVLKFANTVTHEAANSLMLQGQKTELHALIAQWYEHVCFDRLDYISLLLAFHWRAANAPVKMVHYLGRAAERSLKLERHVEASQYLRWALKADLSGVAVLGKARLHRWMGEAQLGLGDHQLAQSHFASALELLKQPLPAQATMPAVLVAVLSAEALWEQSKMSQADIESLYNPPDPVPRPSFRRALIPAVAMSHGEENSIARKTGDWRELCRLNLMLIARPPGAEPVSPDISNISVRSKAPSVTARSTPQSIGELSEVT